MLPTTIVDSAPLPDGGQLVLARRGMEWSVRVNGQILMSSRTSSSEQALAREALARVGSCRSVLVGGLGLGYTLRAVLDRVSSRCVVHVAELVPQLVEWNRSHVGELAGHPLRDARSRVRVGDVFELIQASLGAFDAVLLDVDNGPDAFVDAGNRRLYSRSGLVACRKALRPGGILGVWSARPSTRFEASLRQVGFEAETLRVAAFEGSKASHYLTYGRVVGGRRAPPHRVGGHAR